MSEFSQGSIRKAFLFEQLSNQVTHTTTVNDPFSHNVDVGNDPAGPKRMLWQLRLSPLLRHIWESGISPNNFLHLSLISKHLTLW